MPLNRAPTRLSVAVLAALLAAGAFTRGEAKVVKVPDSKPKVELDVPDDWTVTTAASTVELRSPDKSDLIVLGLSKTGKSEVTAWQKQATQRMMELGVTFDPNARKPKPPPVPNASAALAPVAPAPATVFSGAPSLETPEHAPAVATSTEDKTGAASSFEPLTGKTPAAAGPQLHFHVVTLYGATLGGKPVDAQFFIFAVEKGSALLLQQESSPTDDRVGAIIGSVRHAS